MGEVRIIKRTEGGDKVLYTVELDGETYIVVVAGGFMGIVLNVRTTQQVRSNKIINAVKAAVLKGG